MKFNLKFILRLCIAVISLPGIGFTQMAVPGLPLPPWKEGLLDLHHINTGKGNASFYIFPDGTTMLFDAGESYPADSNRWLARVTVPRPNASKKPYEWIVAYIKQFGPANNRGRLDYAAISHFHDDHFGSWYAKAPVSSTGKYRLTGITGVCDLLPTHYLLDRGDEFPAPLLDPEKKIDSQDQVYLNSLQNYRAFIETQKSNGLIAQSFSAGSKVQIRLLHNADKYPDFYVRNIKSNGHVWIGKDTGTQNILPLFDPGNFKNWPDENSLSLVLTIHYGPFVYYTGGDCAGHLSYGDPPWKDVETPVAKVVGEVDVAVMDHHGNRNALNNFQVMTLKPRVWVELVWSADHPGNDVLIRATNPLLYPGPRDLFATNMIEANKIVIGPRLESAYKSLQGHILVRVMPGGLEYYVIILDDASEHPLVKTVFGPYQTKNKNLEN